MQSIILQEFFLLSWSLISFASNFVWCHGADVKVAWILSTAKCSKIKASG